MKRFISASALCSLACLLLFQTSFTSCKKETITKTDTVVVKDTAISLELLTSNSWKVQELRGVTGNTITYYLRGGSSNTENFDAEYITFNAAKTGIYFDASGVTHQMTWDFSSSTNTKLTFVIQNNGIPSQTVIFDNIRYKNKALYYDQYWTYNNINCHAQGIRIAK